MRRTEYLRHKTLDLSSTQCEVNSSNGYNINIFMRQGNPKDINHLFKVPKMDKRPIRRTTVISPKRRVISGRVNNDAKAKLPKISFRPCPSFINSNRKSIHCSNLKNQQLRKEVIKKMVWLSDHALSEKKEVSESTTVEPIIGFTPKKNLKSHNFFLLPELAKKKVDVNELRTPIKEFVKKEIGSANRALSFIKNPNLTNDDSSDLSINFKNNDIEDSNIFEKLNVSNQNDAVSKTFTLLQQYNSQVGGVYYKLKRLDEIFQNNIKGLPYNEIFDEFQEYQEEKEKLYEEMRSLEDNLKSVFDARLNFGKKLKDYMEQKEKLWEKRMEAHKNFEAFVQTSLQKIKPDTKSKGTPKIMKSPLVEEKPKLRRSLRISKIPRAKKEERTPMSKRLKRVDVKSRGIAKSKK